MWTKVSVIELKYLKQTNNDVIMSILLFSTESKLNDLERLARQEKKYCVYQMKNGQTKQTTELKPSDTNSRKMSNKL